MGLLDIVFGRTVTNRERIEKIKVPGNVYEELIALNRQIHLTADYIDIVKKAEKFGYVAAANWIRQNPQSYKIGFNWGFQPIDNEPHGVIQNIPLPEAPPVHRTISSKSETLHDISPSSIRTQMNDEINQYDPSVNKRPAEILAEIIKNHNPSSISNPSIFTGLLKDYYKGQYKREVRILSISIEENVPQDLLTKKDKIPFSVLSSQLVQKLEDCGFSRELSIWAVDAWAKAMGVE